MVFRRLLCYFVFFFNDTATTEIYTLSLHDALPILVLFPVGSDQRNALTLYQEANAGRFGSLVDRKSTRLNSSHLGISYAVFCLKKKKKQSLYVMVPLIIVILRRLR